jgi:hypothetical protein
MLERLTFAVFHLKRRRFKLAQHSRVLRNCNGCLAPGFAFNPHCCELAENADPQMELHLRKPSSEGG